MTTLQGRCVAVTGARKGSSLAELLRRRGATVVLAPTLAGDVRAPEQDVLRAIDTLLETPPRWFAASTGMGMTVLAEVADANGRGERLRAVLEAATVVARGDKARGGLGRLGLRPAWQSPDEVDRDVEQWLRERVEEHDRVAVQVHGAGGTAYQRLADLDIDLQVLRPYVSADLDDPGPARDLVARLEAGDVDVVTFTSPGAVRGLADIAVTLGRADMLADRLGQGGRTAVAAVGPVTGETVLEQGWHVSIQPDEHRTGALVRAIEAAQSG